MAFRHESSDAAKLTILVFPFFASLCSAYHFLCHKIFVPHHTLHTSLGYIIKGHNHEDMRRRLKYNVLFLSIFCIKLYVRNERIKVTRMNENAYLSIESLKAGHKWLASLTGEQLANGFVTFVTFGLRSWGPLCKILDPHLNLSGHLLCPVFYQHFLCFAVLMLNKKTSRWNRIFSKWRINQDTGEGSCHIEIQYITNSPQIYSK